MIKVPDPINLQSVVAGQTITVAMAQERRACPASAVRWYQAVVKEVHHNPRFATLYCQIEHHADECRRVVVRRTKPNEPNEDWDAIRGPHARIV